MHFILYRRPEARECKIDWEESVDITEDVRRRARRHP